MTTNQTIRGKQSYTSWYWVKYLGLTCTVALIIALIHLWKWPPAADHTRKGLIFLSVASLCVLVSRYRLLVLLAPLTIIASRALIAVVLGVHPFESLTIGAIDGVLLYIVAKNVNLRYKDFPIPEGYSLREIGMDLAIMGPVLLALYLLHRFV